MPQHSMLPDDSNLVGVAVRLWVENPIDPGITANVSCTWDNGVTASVFQQVYESLMVDVLVSLPNEVGLAFLFGEKGDVLRACKSNWKVARAHMAAHLGE